jgi:hypothetical protein
MLARRNSRSSLTDSNVDPSLPSRPREGVAGSAGLLGHETPELEGSTEAGIPTGALGIVHLSGLARRRRAVVAGRQLGGAQRLRVTRRRLAVARGGSSAEKPPVGPARTCRRGPRQAEGAERDAPGGPLRDPRSYGAREIRSLGADRTRPPVWRTELGDPPGVRSALRAIARRHTRLIAALPGRMKRQ